MIDQRRNQHLEGDRLRPQGRVGPCDRETAPPPPSFSSVVKWAVRGKTLPIECKFPIAPFIRDNQVLGWTQMLSPTDRSSAHALTLFACCIRREGGCPGPFFGINDRSCFGPWCERYALQLEIPETVPVESRRRASRVGIDGSLRQLIHIVPMRAVQLQLVHSSDSTRWNV